MTRALTIVAIAALVILTALAAMPVRAGDSAFWYETGCQLVPVQGKAWIAEARCHNVLTPYTAQTVTGEMTVDGLTVGLSVFQGFKEIPDEFTILPPDGYVADPPVLVLEEDQDGVALILPYVGF